MNTLSADHGTPEELVTRVALALNNAGRHVRAPSAAPTFSHHLLPHGASGAVEAAARYLPADTDLGIGGDWFDVMPLSGARVAFVVGEVPGHGINATATAAGLRTAVHMLADMDLTPSELLTCLDDTIRRVTEEGAETPEQASAARGATCLYAVYDPVTRRCAMARAGHPSPAIIDPQGRVTFPDLPDRGSLGLGLERVPFDTVELELPEGSLLAFYTDGLVTSPDQDTAVGMQRLGAALAQPGRSLEDLCASVIENLPARAPSDDVTLLLVRTHTLNPAQVTSWDLPTEPAAVPAARHAVARQLGAWGLEHLVSTMELIVSELVTNAIRYGTGPIRLRLIRHQALTCEVFDADNHCPRLRHARNVDEHGRGLCLIAQLSRRWGFRAVTGGKLVWVEQDLPSTPSRAYDPYSPGCSVRGGCGRGIQVSAA
ncbi:ATP-binding SpoIIE family protein phosphatase [Streptomyces sp. NPDC005708]|uniref:ATP-binding SpoIIE family protein phosphatase n=1 Tax=Streptomyces sp. NPDC005708 TaxID=3154564 RepID=UPI0033F553F5